MRHRIIALSITKSEEQHSDKISDKMKPIFETSITASTKYDWMAKEEGSYEDNNKPETGHIYALLSSMPKTKIVCYSKEEIEMVYKSANYHTSWDTEEDQPLVRKCAKIVLEINQLN